MHATPGIKAIETVFDGHRFRSRLEARWAVVFKSMGFKYEYEPEGYELGGGLKYLPDFWLPSLGVHVEIKPRFPLSRTEWQKLILFSVDGGQSLLLVVGSPGRHEMFALGRNTTDSWDVCEADCEKHGDDDFDDLYHEMLREWANVDFGVAPFRTGYVLVYRTIPPLADCNLGEALAKGGQARFEHARRG